MQRNIISTNLEQDDHENDHEKELATPTQALLIPSSRMPPVTVSMLCIDAVTKSASMRVFECLYLVMFVHKQFYVCI